MGILVSLFRFQTAIRGRTFGTLSCAKFNLPNLPKNRRCEHLDISEVPVGQILSVAVRFEPLIKMDLVQERGDNLLPQFVRLCA
jgi:hypothetical protein